MKVQQILLGMKLSSVHNGLDNFIRLNGSDPPDGVDVDPNADHNEWGRIGVRLTRHSLSGIPSNGQMRLGHKPVCGLCE